MTRIALAAGLCLVPMMGLAEDVTIKTYPGEATVSAMPETVVALDLAAMDTLDALGVAVDGKPDFGTPPAYLTEAMNNAQPVGTLFEPDFEALAAMQPDLIIAGGRSQRQVEPLGAVAPTIDMTIWGDDLIGQAKDRAAAYGTIFGMEDKASEAIAQLDANTEAARAAAEGKGNALIILTNGGKVSAYGDDSRFGWLHTALGIPEAYADITAETHGESVSFEFIAEANPDWMFVIDRGAAIGQEGEAAAATLDNPLVQGTTAGQKGQIVYLDSAAIYLAPGGLQSMNILLGQVKDAFEG